MELKSNNRRVAEDASENAEWKSVHYLKLRGTPTFEQPRIGRSYTLFLTTEPAVAGVFFLSGGPQGLFDIEDNSGVRSHGRPEDPGAVATNGKDRESFLKEVREDARKWPKPRKCCG